VLSVCLVLKAVLCFVQCCGVQVWKTLLFRDHSESQDFCFNPHFGSAHFFSPPGSCYLFQSQQNSSGWQLLFIPRYVFLTTAKFFLVLKWVTLQTRHF